MWPGPVCPGTIATILPCSPRSTSPSLTSDVRLCAGSSVRPREMVRVAVGQEDCQDCISPESAARELSQKRFAPHVVARVDQRHLVVADVHQAEVDETVLHDAYVGSGCKAVDDGTLAADY